MGISLFILRRRRGGAKPPFAVPLYPLLPAIFCLTSAYLLYASLAYAGLGATVGAGVVAAGGMLLFFLKPRIPERSEEHTSELQSLMRISYAVFCLKKKKKTISKARSKQAKSRLKKTQEIASKIHQS